MSESTALLARILANPEDRETRIVYADAIAATDPARGELIVVEDRLRDASGDERVALRQRRVDLLEENAERWWGALPERQLETAGGFVRGVRIEHELDLPVAQELARREPITRLTVVKHAELPAGTTFANLRELELHGPLTEHIIHQWSDVVGHPLDRFAVRMLFVPVDPLRAMPAAKQLAFDGCHADFGALFGAVRDWTAVEELSLAWSTLTDDDLLAVMRQDLRSLRRLKLGGNDLRMRALLALTAALPRMPALEVIDLVDARVPADETAAIQALVDACGSRVAVVRATPAPAVVTFELFNRHFEIRADEDGQRHVLVDGVARPFIFRDDRGAYETKTYAPHAPLLAFARAIAAGLPFLFAGNPQGAATARLRVPREIAFQIDYHHDQLVITQRR